MILFLAILWTLASVHVYRTWLPTVYDSRYVKVTLTILGPFTVTFVFVMCFLVPLFCIIREGWPEIREAVSDNLTYFIKGDFRLHHPERP